jgi:hypothetical protein
MSDHVKSNLGTGQVAMRVLFSLGITAAVAAAAYFSIRWLAGLRP